MPSSLLERMEGQQRSSQCPAQPGNSQVDFCVQKVLLAERQAQTERQTLVANLPDWSMLQGAPQPVHLVADRSVASHLAWPCKHGCLSLHVQGCLRAFRLEQSCHQGVMLHE